MAWARKLERPKYLRGFVWNHSHDYDRAPNPSADATEYATPLPSVPVSEFSHSSITRLVTEYSSFFKIVTPVRVEVLQEILKSHPNRPLVDSVCSGFKIGFWPYADTSSHDSSSPIDNTSPDLSESRRDQNELEFLRSQLNIELRAGRYSPSIGNVLLPGMILQPCFTVPKPPSESAPDVPRFRPINDHSSGRTSLNSFIPPEGGTIRLDTLSDLILCIIRAAQRHNAFPCYIFKSDVSHAFRTIPMHERWQARQPVRLDGEIYIDRNAVFGNRASGKIFCIFMALVCWIGSRVWMLDDLLHYIDDLFSYEYDPELVWYEPYQTSYPAKQTAILRLWDLLGIPHEKSKQLYGRTLVITGLNVSLTDLTITMPPDKHLETIAFIRAFAGPGAPRSHPLKSWQILIGWLNWALNVYPLLKPALQSSYDKMRGKSVPHAPIYRNKDVTRDLLWFADRMEALDGVRFMESTDWPESDADIHVWCDASGVGLGFWSPAHLLGFMSPLNHDDPMTSSDIFYNEALCVVSALYWCTSLGLPPRRVAIHTDSLNTVQIFHTLKATRDYNPLLFFAIELLLLHKLDLRVLHVPGVSNTVADALSRLLPDTAKSLVPGLSVRYFTPPRAMMEAPTK